MRRLSRLPAHERDAQIARLPAACPHADCTTGAGCRDYVAALLGSAVEQRRREGEARQCLRVTGGSLAEVDELIKRVTSMRGEAAANQLRAEMRTQWAKQRKRGTA